MRRGPATLGDAVLGSIASLTGPSADLGALVKAGSEMGVQDVNGKGGVLGRCLKLIVKDDAGDPTTATQVTRELTDQESAEVLVGPVLSAPTGASLEVSARAPVTQFPLSANPVGGDAKTYPHAFMTEFSSSQITESLIAYLKRKGYTKPAVIAVNNALGTFLEGAFTKGIAGSGLTLATAPQLHDTGLPDLSPQVRTLVEAKPDVLVVFQAAGPDQAATVKARNLLFRLPIEVDRLTGQAGELPLLVYGVLLLSVFLFPRGLMSAWWRLRARSAVTRGCRRPSGPVRRSPVRSRR
ncbi:ABC transporter substrate-binding protein [Pseudonocardia sp. GCM10023141]|uniref:ABC transporter substrate-binding protein n=1 Tax=Pseudonocardia sp. GCM10023141 TaxID=3252653 RepID=UPI00360621CE